MGERIWKTISYLFHPILMPTLGIMIVIINDPYIYTSVEPSEFWKLISSYASLTLLCTTMLPVFFAWGLLKTERITSITQPTDKDRLYLIAFTELCFILAYYAVRDIPSIGRSIRFFMLGINVAMIVTFIANMISKVSLHAVGVGGILGTIIGLIYYTHIINYPLIAIAIALVYIVGYSRYKLKAHPAADIYVGNIIGIASQALVFIIMAR